MPGYPREIFEIKVEDKYLCSACRLVLREPFQTYCGHRYCKSCLDEIFRLPGIQMCKQCPQDTQSEDSLLKSDQAFPDRAIKRDIGELPAKCRNAEACEWKGKTQHYDAHQETCEFGLIPCPKQGCGKQVMRMDLAAHLEKECAVRQVKCKYCAQEILLKEEKDHHAFICPQVPVNCEFCGKKKIPRAQMKQHLDENTGDCKRRKVSCTFAKAGCPSKLEWEKLNDHIAKHHVDHLNHLLDKHLTLMEEFTLLKQSGQGQHLQQAVSKMDADMKALFDRIAAMENLASQQGAKLENRLQQMASKQKEMRHKYVAMETRVATFEGIVAVLNREIEKCSATIEAYERQRRQDREIIESLERKKSQGKVRRESINASGKCEWCGKEDLSRAQLQKHQHPDTGDCPNMKIPCTFAPVGCMEMIHRRFLKDHQQQYLADHQIMTLSKLLLLISTLEGRQRQEADPRLMETLVATLEPRIQDIEAKLLWLTQMGVVDRQQVRHAATGVNSNVMQRPEQQLNAAPTLQATSGAPVEQETTDPDILHGRIIQLEKEVAILESAFYRHIEMLSRA